VHHPAGTSAAGSTATAAATAVLRLAGLAFDAGPLRVAECGGDGQFFAEEVAFAGERHGRKSAVRTVVGTWRRAAGASEQHQGEKADADGERKRTFQHAGGT